jgi:hypothetical protein
MRADFRNCPWFGLFGMGEAFGDLQGGQAEYVRVPLADMTLAEVPESLTDDDVILTTAACRRPTPPSCGLGCGTVTPSPWSEQGPSASSWLCVPRCSGRAGSSSSISTLLGRRRSRSWAPCPSIQPTAIRSTKSRSSTVTSASTRWLRPSAMPLRCRRLSPYPRSAEP